MAKKKQIIAENERTVLQPVQFVDAGAKSEALLIPEIDKLNEMSSYKSLRKKRFKRAIIRACVWSIVVALLPVMVFLSVMVFSRPDTGHNFFGYTFYLISSESMEPEIMQWDMIIDKTKFSVDDIEVGSDITYLRASDGKVVTHRVKSFKDTDAGRVYTTRGANNLFDDEPVNFNDVLGVKVRVAPVLGDIVMFFRSVVGMIVMFSLFAGIIVGIYFSLKVSNNIKAVGK